MLFIFFNGSEAEGREKYKLFFDVGTLKLFSPILSLNVLLGPVADLTKEIPYGELNSLQVHDQHFISNG